MLRVHLWISRLKNLWCFSIGVYFLRTKFQDHTTSSFLVMQICVFIFRKAMLQITSQSFPELNALNFFLLQLKGRDFWIHKLKLVIFHLNYILIHLNILPYSLLNWEYLKISALGTTLMTVSIHKPVYWFAQFIDLLCKSVDWCLHDSGPRHEICNIY